MSSWSFMVYLGHGIWGTEVTRKTRARFVS